MIGQFLIENPTEIDVGKGLEDTSDDTGARDFDQSMALLSGGSRCKTEFDKLLKSVMEQENNSVEKSSLARNMLNKESDQLNNKCVRCFIQGPTSSGKTSLVLDWALTLAMECATSHQCCEQCQSHPETCRCNDVEVILCRPGSDPPNEQFPPILLQKISSPQQVLALHRIRIHTVRTRRHFLALLLELQGRPITERPRRAILVDDIHRLVCENYATLDNPLLKYEHDMILSQLGKFSSLLREVSSLFSWLLYEPLLFLSIVLCTLAIENAIGALLIDTARFMATTHPIPAPVQNQRVASSGFLPRSSIPFLVTATKSAQEPRRYDCPTLFSHWINLDGRPR